MDGKRYTVLHAGNKNGFISGAELIFSSVVQYRLPWKNEYNIIFYNGL